MYAKIMFLLALFIGSLGGTVVAADSAHPGDRLYPVDRLIEEVQLRLVRDPVARERLHTEFTEERETEFTEERGETQPVEAREEERPSEGEPAFEPAVGCRATDGTVNPDAEALANELGVPYESALNWFCAGYAKPAIQIAYNMSVMAEVSLDDIYTMRVVEGKTWSQIALDLGLPDSHSFWATGEQGEGDEGNGEVEERPSDSER